MDNGWSRLRRDGTNFRVQQRLLTDELSCIQSLEQVLTQINTLNRSLEGIIEACLPLPPRAAIFPTQLRCQRLTCGSPARQIGNEFSSVEALWSQFENVMSRPEEENGNSHSNNNGNSNGAHAANINHQGDPGSSSK